MASRPVEEAALNEFLDAAASAPAALLVDGEAGIGKTTLWVAGLQRARDRGFRVLSARTAQANSVLAYASLADLLTGVEPDAWADLPEPQRIAVDRVLLRERAADAVTDRRVVAAAFLSVVDRLADDVTSWLQLPRPDAIHRIAVRPLSSSALHNVVRDKLTRPIPPAAMARVHQISAGNPFYAIELARALVESVDEMLLETLADLVRARIGSFEPEAHDVLLAAVSLAKPTVELVGQAAAVDHDRLIELLEAGERKGIVVIEGNRIRFTHPLLAGGVYTDAPPKQRRLMPTSCSTPASPTRVGCAPRRR